MDEIEDTMPGYDRLAREGVIEHIRDEASDKDFDPGYGLADFLLALDKELKFSEFYTLAGPCQHCDQCLAIWLRDEEGREFVKELWKLEMEDR